MFDEEFPIVPCALPAITLITGRQWLLGVTKSKEIVVMAQSTVQTFISPGRYVQGKGAIMRLGEELAQIGKRPLMICDDMVWNIVKDDITTSLKAADLPVIREKFNGIPHPKEIGRFVELLKKHNADIAVSVGGGSTHDTAKAAGHDAGIRWVTVPTTASVDAPTSTLGVIYTEDHAFLEYLYFPRNPDLVLVDTQIVANAPAEFLIAGVGDALATWLEAKAVAGSFSDTIAGDLPTLTGTALARLSWDVLWENAIPAIAAVRDHVVTPALEKVIEANTLLSGLGFESGGLAAAHAIHNGLTAAPQTRGVQHGYKVNVGSVAQLVLEGAPFAEIRAFVEFTTRVGLPTTLTEVGIDVNDAETLRIVAEAATAEGETIHNMSFEVTAESVVYALISVERLSRQIRAEAGLPEPVKYVARH